MSTSRPRILHVYQTFFPDTQGGIEEVIRQIALGTGGAFDVRVFSLSRDPASNGRETGGVQVHYAPLWGRVASTNLPAPTALGLYRRLAAWADLIHYHYPWPPGDLLHLLFAREKPALVTWHLDIVRQRRLRRLYTPLERRFLGRMGYLVATSPQYARSSPLLAGAPHRRVAVVPLGIDPATYPPLDEGMRGRLEARLGQGFFLFIGVLRYYKGLSYLLKAAAGASYRVVVAGEGPEGPALRALAADLGLENLSFLGRVSDAEKIALLDLCRALVLPSHLRSEAFGVVLLEAAMRGRALVSCRIGTGGEYVNRHGRTGLLVPPADPGALAEALDTLYKDPLLAERLGQGAQRRFQAHFTTAHMARAYERIYHRLLARSL